MEKALMTETIIDFLERMYSKFNTSPYPRMIHCEFNGIILDLYPNISKQAMYVEYLIQCKNDGQDVKPLWSLEDLLNMK